MNSAAGDYRDLDSNVYISALQFGGSGTRLLNMARARIIRLDTSGAIVSETIVALRDTFDAGYGQ